MSRQRDAPEAKKDAPARVCLPRKVGGIPECKPVLFDPPLSPDVKRRFKYDFTRVPVSTDSQQAQKTGSQEEESAPSMSPQLPSKGRKLSKPKLDPRLIPPPYLPQRPLPGQPPQKENESSEVEPLVESEISPAVPDSENYRPAAESLERKNRERDLTSTFAGEEAEDTQMGDLITAGANLTGAIPIVRDVRRRLEQALRVDSINVVVDPSGKAGGVMIRWELGRKRRKK